MHGTDWGDVDVGFRFEGHEATATGYRFLTRTTLGVRHSRAWEVWDSLEPVRNYGRAASMTDPAFYEYLLERHWQGNSFDPDSAPELLDADWFEP